jgi:hypothetical protein
MMINLLRLGIIMLDAGIEESPGINYQHYKEIGGERDMGERY